MTTQSAAMHFDAGATGGAGLLRRAFWSPYAVGIGIGVLSWIVFAVVNNPIGITTALSQVSGASAIPILGTEAVAENPYWSKTVPKWDYGTLFLIGTFLGALASSLAGKTFQIETVPDLWKQRFGPARWPRMLVAFAGGIIAMFGARLAGGCTSGHGISGTLQLAVSSWTFLLTMFATAIATAWIVFGFGSSSSERSAS